MQTRESLIAMINALINDRLIVLPDNVLEELFHDLSVLAADWNEYQERKAAHEYR